MFLGSISVACKGQRHGSCKVPALKFGRLQPCAHFACAQPELVEHASTCVHSTRAHAHCAQSRRAPAPSQWQQLLEQDEVRQPAWALPVQETLKRKGTCACLGCPALGSPHLPIGSPPPSEKSGDASDHRRGGGHHLLRQQRDSAFHRHPEAQVPLPFLALPVHSTHSH